MCGRFMLDLLDSKLARLLGVELGGCDGVARFNIAPTQPVFVVRVERGERVGRWLRWGLVPSWAKDVAIGDRLINARSETAHEKPAFRSAFKRRRCLIPADGFYEWRKPSRGGAVSSREGKEPYLITMADGQPFCMCGLWEHWQDVEGNELETCTILTTSANELVGELHDRMPVILDPGDYDAWLEHTTERIELPRRLCRPYPAEMMIHRPVSTYVNSPSHEGPRCVEPVDSAGRPGGGADGEGPGMLF